MISCVYVISITMVSCIKLMFCNCDSEEYWYFSKITETGKSLHITIVITSA